MGWDTAEAQDDTIDVVVQLENARSGVLDAESPFVHREAVLWWTVEAFEPMETDLRRLPPLKDEVAALREYRVEAAAALQAAKVESSALRGQIGLMRESLDLQKRVSDSNFEAFEMTDALLKRERRRNAPLIVHGPTIGVGIPLSSDGSGGVDTGNVAVFAGYGFTFNLSRKR